MLRTLLWLWNRIKAWFARKPRHPQGKHGRRSVPMVGGGTQAKPAWVAREIVRMKALMPDAGCRRIADTFNRRLARHRETGRRMTVGKSFVADTMRRHRYEIESRARCARTTSRCLPVACFAPSWRLQASATSAPIPAVRGRTGGSSGCSGR